MDAQLVLDEVREEVLTLGERQAVRLSDIIDFFVKLPPKAFLRGHRERALAYLLWDAASEDLLNLDREVRVAAAEVGGFTALIVASGEGYREPCLTNLLVNAAVSALNLARDVDMAFSLALPNVRNALRRHVEYLFGGTCDAAVRAVVFGLDEDSGMLYAHTLPEPLASGVAAAASLDGLTEGLLRSVMGFDLQPWEAAASGAIREGVRVRVQGDLAVEVLEVCAERCSLALLPVALRVLGGDATAKAAGYLQRLLLDIDIDCSEAVERPERILEIVEERLRVPAWALDGLLRVIGAAASGSIRGLGMYSFYVKLNGCSAKLKLESFRHPMLVVYDGVYGVKLIRIRGASPESVDALALKLLAAKVANELSEPFKFEVAINGNHAVRGVGVAAASDVPTEELGLPTTARRVAEAMSLATSTLPGTTVEGLTRLAATATFYARSGDLYAYVPDGRLEFSHPEHGETIMDLGEPAVVRVTELNIAERPSDDALRLAARLLGGGGGGREG